MKKIFLIISLFSLIAQANTAGRNLYPPTAIGSDALNTNFENLSCTQMIGRFLSYVGSSGLGQQGIERRFRACLAQARSGVVGSILSTVRMNRGAEEACLETANQEQRNYENAKRGFISALIVKQNLYNAESVARSNRSLLHKCSPSEAAELRRRPGESDNDYIRRAAYNCPITYETSQFRFEAFRQAHVRAGTFEDYEVCYNYRVEYDREQNPPLRISNPNTPPPQASTASPAGGDPKCKPLTCEQVFRPNAINIPSPCYRNKVIDCSVNGPAPSGNSGSGGRVSTGN